ncbi:MAG: T9SS type A sorting domain-containing protein [Bacteroidota bacterium]
MKKIATVLLSFISVSVVFAQGLWIQKETFPFTSAAGVSFSIGTNGYMYTGQALNNFFMYDALADTWVAKADFPGGLRTGAAGFATDSFGFVGCGKGTNYLNDFYRYDPTTDSWTARANYPDSIESAFSFSINGMGYLAGGFTGLVTTRECYGYDVANDQWIAKDSMPIALREGFSAVANGKAYCGLGRQTTSFRIDSVYEYDAVADSWQSRAGYRLSHNSATRMVHAFTINDIIYVSNPLTTIYSKLGVYNVALNSWSEVYSYPRDGVIGANCTHQDMGTLTINNRGYLASDCIYNSFWEFDPANHFTINSFTPDTLCEQDSIQVTFSSSLSFNPGNRFVLKVGTASCDSISATSAGTYTFKTPHVLSSSNQALIDLKLFSTDPPRQSGFIPDNLLVKDAPYEQRWAPSYTRCAGSAILLYRSGEGIPTISMWSYLGINPISTGYAYASLSPTQDAMVYITDSVVTTGCVVKDSTLIKYYDLPFLQISDSVFSICNGMSVTLGGTVVTNGEYQWTGSGLNSTLVNPVVTPPSNRSYAVALTDTITGCVVRGNTQVNISEPPAQPICFVTVDSASTHSIVVWEKTDKPATDSFIIYREISTNNYQPVGAVHGDSLSEFHDYGANPNVTGYRYKIATVDTCGKTGTSSLYHNTIHLRYLGNGNMQWNVYEIENTVITPVNSFDVYRDSLGNGNWHLMVNVSGNQYTATDINFSQHPNALYRVVANWAYTCTAQRSGSNRVLSNVMVITPTGITAADAATEISLFPNPALNELYIRTSNNTIEQVRILNLTGSVINTLQPVNNRLDISLLPAGVYIAEITTKDSPVMKRWVKM